MTRRTATLLAAGAAAGALLLAGCGASSAPSVTAPDPSASAVTLSSDPATCTKATKTSDCTVRVWYSNVSRSNVDVDPTSTRLVDATGAAYRPVPQGDVPAGLLVTPGGKVFVVWTLTLPVDTSLSAVTWLGTDGLSQTAPLVLAATGSSPSPSPTASAKPTPKPTPKPKPKPTPVATKKTTTSTGSRSNGGSKPTASKPPVSGTIG